MRRGISASSCLVTNMTQSQAGACPLSLSLADAAAAAGLAQRAIAHDSRAETKLEHLDSRVAVSDKTCCDSDVV